MSLLKTVKRISIATGAYRAVRYLSRHIRPSRLRALSQDIAFYRSLLPPGALCFDVGANIGEKSEALLEAGARVVAFEPNLDILPELQARCARNPDWAVLPTAVGSGPGIVMLHVRAAHGQSSLAAEWEGEVIATHHVPAVTLDTAINHFGVPYYCKIDVEGWESQVLEGLSQLIPLLSFEFHLTEESVSITRSCLARLLQLGFREVNITAAESSLFHFEKWTPLDRFSGWFPGDLADTLPGHPYGDIYARVTAL